MREKGIQKANEQEKKGVMIEVPSSSSSRSDSDSDSESSLYYWKCIYIYCRYENKIYLFLEKIR